MVGVGRLMADTPDPQPLDLTLIRLRWADADENSGTLRWNPIVRDLIAEVERLRAENADLRHEVADLELDLRAEANR